MIGHTYPRLGEMNSSWEDADIVIVGAGISGLATALALHSISTIFHLWTEYIYRKGISSIVLEKSNRLRTNGAGIGVHANAWRALDQLGVGITLREKALPLLGLQELSLDKGTTDVVLRKEESRCLLRRDLIQTIFDGLPPGTVRYGCRVLEVKSDPMNSRSILHFLDGSTATAKIVIGCDGVNSAVAKSLKLKPVRNYPTGETRGITRYPNGHGFTHVFLRTRRGSIEAGRLPINDKLVYWFVTRPWLPKDSEISGKPNVIRQRTMDSVVGFPSETIEMVKNSEDASLSHKRLTYKSPWGLLVEQFREGAVTVAGDAMHAMGPFLGQGGAASLEDAVVLGRCLGEAMRTSPNGDAGEVGMALDKYVKERRMRVAVLAMQTYLYGLFQANSSKFLGGLILLVLKALSRGALRPTRYDCGPL